MAPYFKKMEQWQGADDGSGLRGTDGPLHVRQGQNALGTGLYEAFARAGEEAGYGSTRDYNGFRQGPTMPPSLAAGIACGAL